MAAVDAADTHEHDDHSHDHAPFIAHHFDSARQQFDSGKLGIWVFLVTEVLFFSGLFVAYTLYRFHNPEVCQQAHYFLDTMLGAANTVVLLFSSLTVALAVRAAQLENHRQVVINVVITIACAAFFLGVKAVEYSHKWDMGLLPAGYFSFTWPQHHHEGISGWLIMLCIVPTVLTVLSLAAGLFLWFTDSRLWGSFWILLAIGLSGFLIGAVGAQLYQSSSLAPELRIDEVAAVTGHIAESKDHQDGHSGEAHLSGTHSPSETSKNDSTDSMKGGDGENQTAEKSHDAAAVAETENDAEAHAADAATGPPEFLENRIGVFFSIYYCMTGLHAIHIIGGIIFLAWLLFRSLRKDWRSDFYGPVEYVGLYWHLVDLIWIYLFPLFYLIN
jgi:cytochrome c oxidase subunit III